MHVTYVADSCILLFSCTDTPPDLRIFKLTQLLTYKNFKSQKGGGDNGNSFEMLVTGRLWQKNTVG
jgi:hypothetical protein